MAQQALALLFQPKPILWFCKQLASLHVSHTRILATMLPEPHRGGNVRARQDRQGQILDFVNREKGIVIQGHHSKEPVTVFPFLPLPSIRTAKLHTSYRGQVSHPGSSSRAISRCCIWHILKMPVLWHSLTLAHNLDNHFNSIFHPLLSVSCCPDVVNLHSWLHRQARTEKAA